MRKLYNLKYNSQADALLDLMNRKIVGSSLQEFSAGTIAVIIASPKLLSPAVFDEEMVMTTPPVYEDGFFVDVILERTEVFTNTVEGSTNTISGFVEVEPNASEQYDADVALGKSLVKKYILDNDALGVKMTPEQTQATIEAFSKLTAAADLGRLSLLRGGIASIPTSMLSVERQEEYLAIIDNYLSSK